MNVSPHYTADNHSFVRLRNWNVGLLLLTAIHHAWGAFIYAAPFRLHVVFIAIPLGVLISWLLRIARLRSGQADHGAGLLLATLALVVVVIAAIGLFEGGFNHVVKNALFFGGASPQLMASLFPPPAYEMPDNFLFEVTGILQLPVSLFAAAAGLKLLRQEGGQGASQRALKDTK